MVCLRRSSSVGTSSSSQHLAVDARAHEALRAQLLEHLHVLALALAHHRRQQHERAPSGSARTWSTIWLTVCASSGHAVVRAARRADAREQQAQVVVDLGDRADGGARVVRGRLLLDRDRRRQALDVVDVRLLHHRQELARVGRQRLDVAALALGVDGVEGERGLAGAGQAGDDDQLVARQVEVDVLEVVGARAANADHVHGPEDGWGTL